MFVYLVNIKFKAACLITYTNYEHGLHCNHLVSRQFQMPRSPLSLHRVFHEWSILIDTFLLQWGLEIHHSACARARPSFQLLKDLTWISELDVNFIQAEFYLSWFKLFILRKHGGRANLWEMRYTSATLVRRRYYTSSNFRYF